MDTALLVKALAFMQQRAANGDSGKNWLIFGNQRLADDFLYQLEWIDYRKDGILTRADLAWSRQGEHKVYVQHKIAEHAAEVWNWLQQGAHLYVCGEATRMARDVETALLNVIKLSANTERKKDTEFINDSKITITTWALRRRF